MSGIGNHLSSSSLSGAGSSMNTGRRVSKLGMAAGSNSKRKRSRRPLLQSAKRRILNCALFSALFVFAVGIYRSSNIFFSPLSGARVKPFSIRRRTADANASYQEAPVAEAFTDITTKALYDEIEFKNEEGGVWRQGWNVQYRGNEWDQEQLKVLVVPHSHNDPGWLRTVEEYYQERSRKILSTIVQSLNKDKRRKFIWEEISFLERWWQDASNTEKEDFKRLVRTGQLEVVGGGWVMNDEANSHYFAIIQQMIAGNLWLLGTLGVAVKNAWAIDPFGHSPTMAYLLRRMGFKNMLIQRTHYEVKKALARKKSLEFVWRQSWDAGNATDIFCHMMPFYSYDIPHTCGPEPAICCQFDFWRLPHVYGAEKCPWRRDPVEITSENVKERAEMLLDQYRKKSTLYRSNTLLVPLGDDFRYITTQEAELQFTNLQLIFDYINSQPYLRASVQFGTLEDYFSTLRAEAGQVSSSDQASAVPGYPTLSGDFFTYADREHDYWSGYYVSRPFYKAVDRVLEETLRGADILFTLASAYCRPSGNSEFPLSSTLQLISARRNLALFQHHDGVTGTAKDHVVVDYGERMHVSVQNMLRFMADSVTTLLGKRTPARKCANHNREELDFYVPEQARTRHDMLPVKTVLEVIGEEGERRGRGNRDHRSHEVAWKSQFKYQPSTSSLYFGDQVRRVVLFNSLEETLEQVVTVLVEEGLLCVFDSEWRPVPSQVSPEWTTGSAATRPHTARHRLQWHAKVPPMGLQTYIVAHSATAESCIKATAARLEVYNAPADFVCPASYACELKRDYRVDIENQHQTLEFRADNGLLQGLRIKGGQTVAVDEELAFYSSVGSGAYLFAPNGEAQSFVTSGGLILVVKGPLMEEVYTKPNCHLESVPVVRSARLYAGSSVQASVAEMEYHTELLHKAFNDKELIARFKTELNNKKVFYSDLNGFQTIRRETFDKIPLQGNYYPMPSLAFIQCPGGRRFSIHSRQALGVASLGKGWLEVMLDRRLVHDDGRGLGQGVLDNHPNSVVFHLLLERNVSQAPTLELSSSSRVPSLLSHRAGAQLNHPLRAFLGRPEARANIEKSSTGKDPLHKLAFAPVVGDLPCDLHVVSLQGLDAAGISGSSDRSVGLLLQRRGFDASYGLGQDMNEKEKCSTFPEFGLPLHSIFRDLVVSNARSTSLNLVHDREEQFGAVIEQVQHRKQRGGSKGETTAGIVEIGPMEIEAYKFQLNLGVNFE